MAEEQASAQAEPKDEPKTYDEAAVKAMIEEATKGLKAKNDELLGEKKTAAQKAREAEEAAQKIADEAARKAGDTEALEKSWQAKFEKAMADKEQELGTYKGMVEGLTVGQQATKIASELAVQGSAGVLERLIAPRLAYEMRDGQAHVVVRDASGKPSAATVDELKEELLADPAYAPLIFSNKASGAERPGANGGAGKVKTMQRSDWQKLTPKERSTFLKDGKLID